MVSFVAPRSLAALLAKAFDAMPTGATSSSVKNSVAGPQSFENEHFDTFEQFPATIPRDVFGVVCFGTLPLIQSFVVRHPACLSQRDPSGFFVGLFQFFFGVTNAYSLSRISHQHSQATLLYTGAPVVIHLRQRNIC